MTEREVIQLVGWLFLLSCIGLAIFGIVYDMLQPHPWDKDKTDKEIDLAYREMYGEEGD